MTGAPALAAGVGGPGQVNLMLVMSGSDRDKLLRLVNTCGAPVYGSQITRMPGFRGSKRPANSPTSPTSWTGTCCSFARGSASCKWGSCTPSSRRVWLNSELAKKPVECIEYIVVHELLHLLEAKHGARFMALMSRHLPHWPATQKPLNAAPLGHEEWDSRWSRRLAARDR
jgi:hypothetical protein